MIDTVKWLPLFFQGMSYPNAACLYHPQTQAPTFNKVTEILCVGQPVFQEILYADASSSCWKCHGLVV